MKKHISRILALLMVFGSIAVHIPAMEVKASNQAEALVSVAKSQLGMKERSNGSDDIVYNDWYYGRQVNNGGVAAKYAWCAVFVSWCADQAGIPTSIIPKTANTTDMKNKLINSGGVSHLKGSGYAPKCGDIIFFGSNASQHVGIVKSSSGNTVYYIDGNNTSMTPHGVHDSNCSLSYGNLWGFVTPNYSASSVTASPPYVHAWMSDTGMGNPPSSYRTGSRYYLCYELIDQASGKRFNEVADANYTVTETIYKPDGSVAFSYSYEKSDNNWIAHVPQEEGVYRGKVEITGDYIGDTEVSFEVKEHKVMLHSWFSESKMGEATKSSKKGTMYYLCYEIIDSDTGKPTSDLDGQSYTVTETIYKPDGSVGHTNSYDSSVSNWIGLRFEDEGTYKGIVTFTQNDYSANVTSETTVAHTHSYTAKVTREATCAVSGVKTYKCSCGESYTETIPKTEHSWDSGKITLQATTASEGVRTYTCTICGITKTEKIPVLVQASGSGAGSGATEPDGPSGSGTDSKPDGPSGSGTDSKPDGPSGSGTDSKPDGPSGSGTDSKPDGPSGSGTDSKPDGPSGSGTDNKPDNISSESEEDNMEEGDIFQDDSGSAEYEVISKNGGAVYVEYTENLNSKAAVVKIPATIEAEDGTICKVTSIASGAFKKNKKIKKVYIGSNVETIRANAFYGCKNLTSVSMGKNLDSIGSNAFSGCAKLTSLMIPSKVKRIGSNAFYGCRNLKKVTVKTSKLTSKGLGRKAFKGIPAKAVFQVPKGKVKTYSKLFRQKGLHRKIKII